MIDGMRWATVLSILASASLLGISACRGGLTDLDELEVVGSGGERDEAALEGGSGFVKVEGTIRTPSPCHDLSARMRAAGREVELEVVATPQDVPCITIAGRLRYRAFVRDLSAGTYRFHIRHRVRGSTTWEARATVEVLP